MVESKTAEQLLESCSKEQRSKLEAFADRLVEQNKKINLISRKDHQQVWNRHVLHSLALVPFLDKSDISHIVDLGTGGGLPGLPLAILFPAKQFTLLDSIAKKMRAVEEMRQSLELDNVEVVRTRAEAFQPTVKADAVVSRAVAPCKKLIEWSSKWVKNKAPYFFLKGGDLTQELADQPYKSTVYSLAQFAEDDFFTTKKIVHLYR